MLQTVAIVVSLALTAVTVAVVAMAVRSMLGVIRQGQPALGRTDDPARRTITMLKETFGHTRMLQWTWVGIMHWFVFMAFLFLSTAVGAAYFQLFDPEFAWPLIGHFYPFEWFSEFIGLLSTIGIVFLIIYRQKNHPRSLGRKSRFFGSTFWQAYFVEFLALFEGAAILFVRGAEYNLGVAEGHDNATRAHFPIASFFGDVLYPSGHDSVGSLENVIYAIATFKILLALVWLIVVARNLTMGIAWHRFTAWFNIWFKRDSSGRTALGAIKPLTSDGKAITLDDIDDLDEDATLGAGSINDFSWKGILDFTTCTECGRCQSQCPAWNTDKPLSPKLLIMGLREHAYATAAGDPDHQGRALVGKSSEDVDVADAGMERWFYNPDGRDYVIDEDVLWSCTSCGACVQQCPVDIEHVDHIMDMRRYQVLVESSFPSELNGLFKGLENKGNPWNMSATARMDWAKGLPFDVKVVGETIESLDEVDWLFWVGCAGAYEDRAKKTTRAVAELLDLAGVSFGVLGNGETCTGDPARRAGNEFVFQGLAQQNIEVLTEAKAKKVVSTCPHCMNTLKNEYKDLGIELEVIHHTQLLNRLVREGQLTPVKTGEGAHERKITYHDPCYLGRHNQVYTPPRDLLQIMPGAELKEMERNSERSFCCGAGGARMWMEETLGERINVNRTNEAVGTGADQIAVGCPFCRVMLSDGLTAAQASGTAREEVEVLDVAQMLLASVKGEVATKFKPGHGAAAAPAAKAAPAERAAPPAGAGAAGAASVETKAEPEAGDVTLTEDTVADTADVGPAAKASGGSSLFDAHATEAAPTDEPASGGSLFDEASATPPASGGSLFDTPAPAEAKPAADEKPAGSGSLFDTPAPAETKPPAEAKAAPAAEEKPAAGGSLFDVGGGGSLFDTPAPAEGRPAAEQKPAPAAEEKPAPAAEPAADPMASGGSLFDIAEPPTPEAPAAPAAPAGAAEPEAAPAQHTPVPTEEAVIEAELTGGVEAYAPRTEVPSSGSLFDIVAPEPHRSKPATGEAPVPGPTDETEPVDSDARAEEAEAEAAEYAASTAAAPKPEAEAPASAPAPSAEIPTEGSLFDIVAPEPAAPAAPAPAAPVAEVAPEAAPAAEEAVVEEAAVEESAPVAESAAPAPPAAPAPTGPTPGTEIPTEGSLFDIPAPAPAAPAAGASPAAAPPEPAAPAEPPAPAESVVDEPVADEPVADEPVADEPVAVEGAPADGDESAPEEPVEEAASADEPEPATEQPTAEQPARERAGEANQPRTDVDINSSGSLFDL